MISRANKSPMTDRIEITRTGTIPREYAELSFRYLILLQRVRAHIAKEKMLVNVLVQFGILLSRRYCIAIVLGEFAEFVNID